MNSPTRNSFAAALLFAGMMCSAQSSADRPADVAGPVKLVAQPDVLRGAVEAFPRVLPGPGVSDAVSAKINAALTRANARARKAALDCRTSFREAQGKADPRAWRRSVSVTMRGPEFLALMATDSYYCGGPYPNDGLQMPLVYDLTTGSPVNWLKLLPPSVKATPGNAADGSNTGAVNWPAVTALAKKQAQPECAEAYKENPDFALNLDARSGTLALTPSDFPHVIQACADSVDLTGDDLRKLHVAPRLIDALHTAHALQATTKK